MAWFSRIRVDAAPVLALSLFSAGHVHAQGSKPEEEAVARSLFDEAMTLKNKGDIVRACPKFEEVVRLQQEWVVPTLYLGECYEATERTASAWAKYKRVVTLASKTTTNKSEAKKAQEQIAYLFPRLSKLVIHVSPQVAGQPGLVITQDGEDKPSAQWEDPLPIDPGKHHLMATAPGKKTWDFDVEIRSGALVQSVDVPLLEDVPTPAPPVDPSPGSVVKPISPPPPVEPPPGPSIEPPASPPHLVPPPQSATGVPGWAWISGAAGAVLITGSVGFFADYQSVQGNIDAHCTATMCDTRNGFRVKDENSHLWRSFGLFVGLGSAGVLALAGGIYGRATSVSRGTTAPLVGPNLRWVPEAWFASGTGGVRVQGQF
jgi:hypothetical protein